MQRAHSLFLQIPKQLDLVELVEVKQVQHQLVVLVEDTSKKQFMLPLQVLPLVLF
jgi:hypothetical protein